MGTAFFTNCTFSWRKQQQMMIPSPQFFSQTSLEYGILRTKAALGSTESGSIEEESEKYSSSLVNRRTILASGVSLASPAVLGLSGQSLAVVKQGLLAGRVPGLSEPNEQGWRTYRRPDEKSGGHGVGWSPIIPYTFSVPQDWEETPVSIADLGGTEIDLRFGSSKEGRLFVIVAPVLRFADSLQWKRHYKDLKRIAESFRVV